MKSVVTNRQIFFLLLLASSAYSIISLPKNAVLASGTGAWFTLLLLTVVFMFGIFVLTSLSKKFAGKAITEYSKVLIGNVGSYIISAFYTGYLLLILILLTRSISETITSSFLPKTPVFALLLLFFIVCTFIASKGVTNIARLCEIYGILFIIVSILTHIVMFIFGDFIYLKPLFEVSKLKDYIYGAKDLIVPFLGYEILALIPFGKTNLKSGRKTAVLSLLYIGFFFIFAVESSISIVGINNIIYYDATLIEALRETHIPPTFILERPDLVFIMIGTFALIAQQSIILFSARQFIINIIKKKNKIVFAVILVISYVLALLISDKLLQSLLKSVLPVIGIFTSLIIPSVLLIISKVKKYEKN